MAQDEKQWHPRFLKYMNSIINHPNYSGLPIKKRADNSYAWIATAKSEIGRGRKDWCIDKAIKLGFINTHKDYPGMYADVMLEIVLVKQNCNTFPQKIKPSVSAKG